MNNTSRNGKTRATGHSTPSRNGVHRAHPAKKTGTARRSTPRRRSAGTSYRPLQSARAKRKPALILAFIVALVVLGSAAGLATTSFLGSSSTVKMAKEPATASAPYDLDGFENANGRMTYSENGVLKSQVGIDVSEHQGSIDWNAVADDGIQFAFVRAGNRGNTEGTIAADDYYTANITGAKAAGLHVGVYFYSQAISVEEAREEADFVLGLLSGQTLDLPIVFDNESDLTQYARVNDVDSDTLTAAAVAFCERVEAAGYSSMVYGNRSDLARYDLSGIGNRNIWFAEYGTAYPSLNTTFAIWQYANDGVVAGIDGSVDMDILFTDAL